MTWRTRKILNAAYRWTPPHNVDYSIGIRPLDGSIYAHMMCGDCEHGLEFEMNAPPGLIGQALDQMCSALLAEADEVARMQKMLDAAFSHFSGAIAPYVKPKSWKHLLPY